MKYVKDQDFRSRFLLSHRAHRGPQQRAAGSVQVNQISRIKMQNHKVKNKIIKPQNDLAQHSRNQKRAWNSVFKRV